MESLNESRRPLMDQKAIDQPEYAQAIHEWRDLIDKHAAKFGGDRARGAIAANRENPALRKRVDELAGI